MIYINERQAQLIELIRDRPDMSYAEITEITGWPTRGIGERFKVLIRKGIVSREGNQRIFKHYTTDEPYTVTPDGRPPAESEVIEEDELLNTLTTFKATEEQRSFLEQHKSLPRSELARRLGISKLEVNHALLQMGLGKK